MKISIDKSLKVAISIVIAVIFIIFGIVGMVIILDIFRDALVSYQDRFILGATTSISDNIELYLNQYKKSINSLVQQNRTLEAEKSYLDRGYSDRILRVLQFNIARQGGNIKSMAVFSPTGEFIISSDGLEYKFLKDNLEIKAQEVNTYLSEDAIGNMFIALCSRSRNGLFYTAYIPIKTMFQVVTEQTNTDKKLYYILYANNRKYAYYIDDNKVSVLDLNQINSSHLDLEDLTAKISKNPNSYAQEISFELKNTQWTCLIGGKEISLNFDSLFLISAMKLDKIVAPVQRSAVVLLVCIILFLLGIFWIIRCILLISRRNVQALNEIKILKGRSKMLEEINRLEQEIAHEQRLQEIGTMASGIAHEFNNLLTPIMGHSIMMLDTIPASDTDKYDSLLEVYNASLKAKEIIDQLSYLSRKNVDSTYSTIFINELIDKGVNIATFAKKGNIKIVKEYNTEGVYIYGNETLLIQTLVNIFINAYQAMNEMGGTLTIKTYCEDRNVIIEISDTGEGMDESIISRIFDPFFTTKGKEKGTGLGLTIVKKIIEEHNGIIWAFNNEVRGTTFIIRLPISKQTYKYIS